MKVTVCFGVVRIVVPCGNGDLLVRDLINEAIRRYRKATGKEPDSWVSVQHLQTQSGILDPDDCIRDVADDREQILASFEDSGPDPGVPQGGGDGASGSSSVGTGSPDIFRDANAETAPRTNKRRGLAGDRSTPHIEVTSTTPCPVTGLGLQVRRSSDPNLLASLKADGGNKRWSAAAPHCAGDSPDRVLEKSGGGGYLSPQWEEDDDQSSQALAQPSQQHFPRSGRLSMQFLGDGTGYRWMEAAEKLQQNQRGQYQQQTGDFTNHQQAEQYNFVHGSSPNQYSDASVAYSTKSLPRESKRKEPLGQAYESIREKEGEMLLVINEPGSPLGLTAIPDHQNRGGLLVQQVEPGSRAERGRLRRGDRILEINGMKLLGLTEAKVQEHLRHSLETSELRIRVMRANSAGAGKMRRRDSKVAEMIEAEEKFARCTESKVATVSPTRKSHISAPAGASLQVANTRKLGRKIEIVLKKGPNGLGFSVTTRDNPAGGHCPIYIKNILPRGAAIEDGRLKPGDRLLEVDGVPMTGKTQTDVVSVLRATQPGAVVSIVVSRQQDPTKADEQEIKHGGKKDVVQSPLKQPAPDRREQPELQPSQQDSNRPTEVQKSSSARSLFEQHHRQQQYSLNESQHFIDGGSESAASNDSIQASVSWRSREVLTLHIPVHDTEKAGLGVSVKGKTSSNANSSSGDGKSHVKHDGDLGIFVKNVIHGGAASRDGRLQMNDQLMSVNGVSLLGQNNAEAMETLRRAMVNKPGKHPGMITLTVARKLLRSVSSGDIIEHTNDSSNNSENSGTTVIYLSPDKKEAHVSVQGSTGDKTDVNRWSNPVLDRLTGGACSASAFHGHGDQLSKSSEQGTYAGLNPLRNDSYYIATNDTWSPAVPPKHLPSGRQFNNAVLIEDDPEPMSPTLPHRLNESTGTQSSSTSHPTGNSTANFDATYSSQLSLETNNSGVEHFSRDALGRRSISEKHHAALDARETGTYQRNKKLREERERRIQLTKSAVFSGSMESLTARIANANAQIPGYKHTKTASGIDPQQLQKEAQDEVGDLGPSLGMKKSSSLESLQTMVQEIQMSDEPRGPSALRAPRGRGREDSLRAAVVSDVDIGKARKHWLLEETDGDGGFANRNGPFQSSLNDGKHKSRAKKPSILRGIGHMFRFGKNRKDVVAPVPEAAIHSTERPDAPSLNKINYPAAALSSMERNIKLPPPAYQPPPALNHGNNTIKAGPVNATLPGNGIHQSDIFNHRYQHYSNYEEMYQQQLSGPNNDVLSEFTLDCMRQQVLKQHMKMEAESRRHQHYHSQRSARSQDVGMQPLYGYAHHNDSKSGGSAATMSGLRPTSSYYEYETVQHGGRGRKNSNEHRMPSTGHNKSNISSPAAAANANESPQLPPPNAVSPQQQMAQQAMPQWKFAAMNGFSPQSLNSSARSRGPFVTQVTIRESGSPSAAQPTQQHSTMAPHHHGQFVNADSGLSGSGAQSQASKV